MELNVLECTISDLNDFLADGTLDVTTPVRNNDGRMISLLSYVAANCISADCETRLNNLIALGGAIVTEETLWYALNNVVWPRHFGILELLFDYREDSVPLPLDSVCLAVKKAIVGTPADSRKTLQLVLDNNGDPNSTFLSAAETGLTFEMHITDTPLSIAVQHLPIFGKGTMQLQIIDLLLEFKANPNEYNPPSSESLLHLAARRNSAIVIQRLIEAGTESKLSHSNQCALHVALQESKQLNVSKCSQLIHHCSQYINTKDSNENTALLAFFVSRTKWPISVTPPMISTIFRDLINAGADVSVKTSRGETFAHLVAGLSGQGEMTRAVLQIINEIRPQLFQCKTKNEGTILHAFNLNIAAIAVAIKHGIDINAQDKNGKTALHFAVERNRLELVTVLLSHGSNPKIRDSSEHKPLFYQKELLDNYETEKIAKQIRSRIQRASKRPSDEGVTLPPSKYSKILFHSITLDNEVSDDEINILHIPLEIIFHIFGLLDPLALIRCEQVCNGWKDILAGSDGTRFWKTFCNEHFWCPKGGWEAYLARSPRRGKIFSAKEFYHEMLDSTCKGCYRRTSAYRELFGERVCRSCLYSDDKYYYYSKTEIKALQLTRIDLKNVFSVTKKKMMNRSVTEYRASEIEPIVFKKYGETDGAKRLLVLGQKRALGRNFNFRISRMYSHLVETSPMNAANGSC